MVPGKAVLCNKNFKYVTLALQLGSGWTLVGLQEYCKCKLKGPREPEAEGSYNKMEELFEDGKKGILVI